MFTCFGELGELMTGTVPDSAAMHEANTKVWDVRVDIHYRSDWYDVASFLAGESALDPIELDAVGPYAVGSRLLHLHCHFGLGTLSWERLGATPVGVDYSQRAIDVARNLAQRAQLPRSIFRCTPVEAIDDEPGFDVCVATWGVLAWISDLDAWAAGALRALNVGGVFFLADEHPHHFIWDHTVNDRLSARRSYFDRSHLVDPDAGTYIDPEARLSLPAFRWHHTLADVLTALSRAGLDIEEVEEYPEMPWRALPWMIPGRMNGFWRHPADALPVAFSVRGRKRPARLSV